MSCEEVGMQAYWLRPLKFASKLMYFNNVAWTIKPTCAGDVVENVVEFLEKKIVNKVVKIQIIYLTIHVSNSFFCVENFAFSSVVHGQLVYYK